MPLRRRGRPRRRRYYPPLFSRKQQFKAMLILIIIGIIIIITKCSIFLKELSGAMALSDASDLVTLAINNTINRKMSEGMYDYNYFVNLEKDNEGNITAITTNMSRINTFSSEVLKDVVSASDSGNLRIEVPIGNLLGMNITVGKGPCVPVDIILLTSSYTDFRNELTSAGINQTRHQMILEVVVDIDILVPWETMSTRVVAETLIAETVIVGEVPDTYLDTEKE